jgi:hypothetical protein
LLNGGLTDSLCQVAFPGASGTKKQRVFSPADERGGGQIEDQTAIHFWVEGEVEVIQCSIGIAERGLFAATIEQAIRAAREFVGDQTRDQIDGRHRFGLRLT